MIDGETIVMYDHSALWPEFILHIIDIFLSPSSAESSGGEGAGAVCLYTLKNPSAPERILRTESGVTSVHFHPTVKYFP